MINLGHLPVWEGVQPQPGFHTLPFCLTSEKGLVRLRLTQEDQNSVTQRYGLQSYTFITTPPGKSEWGSALGNSFFNALSGVVKHLEGKSVLEIGSGSLYIAERVVKELKCASFVACDPVLKQEVGTTVDRIKVVSEYFSYPQFKEDRFDLILSLNNLEHIPDPFQYLKDVRDLLERSGGDFFVVVPDCTRGLEKGDWGICLHEHLNYFTVSSFKSLVVDAGFEVKHLNTDDDKIIALLTPEKISKRENYSASEVLEKFQSRCLDNLDRADKLLNSFRKNKKSPLGIHGCSVGLNNIFALLGVRSDPDIFLFDGDTMKTGKYFPTFNKKIMHATDPMYKEMKNIVVGVTTFYNRIHSFAVQHHHFPEDRLHSLFSLS